MERIPLGEGSMDDEEYREPSTRVVVRDGKPSVRRGDVLVKTPTHLLLHSGLVPPSKLPDTFDDHERLVYLVAEEARNTDSKWRKYFEVVPRTFNTPLHWTDEEVSMLSDMPTQYGHAGERR